MQPGGVTVAPMSRLLLLSVALAGCVSGRANAQDAQDPMTITTDTPEYCIGLADRLASGEMPPHARVLWRSGRLMCEQGDVRHGLARIRRALMMVQGVAE